MNIHNRYCRKCYVRTIYLYHQNNLPWSICPSCNKSLHLYDTIGEQRFYMNKNIYRDKKLNKILK